MVQFLSAVNEFFEIHGDPRLAEWSLMSSPWLTIGLCLTYIYFVKILGPQLMQKREPFQLKAVLLFYNLFQVLLNAYIVYGGGMSGWFTGDYSFRCQPVDYSNKPNTLRMLYFCRIYFLAKFTEFLDTIFCVMRKKFDQVTALHVIHHSAMPVGCWFGLKFAAGGHLSLFGLLNSFVHVILYGYYFLSALGPKIQKYLWWKKYVTILEIVQFVVIFVHASQLFFIDCDISRVLAWIVMLYALVFSVLFTNFYLKTYNKEKLSTN